MMDTLNGRDIWVRHTDAVGNSHVQVHRVWDGARLIESLQQAAGKMNADAIKAGEPAKARVQQITEEQYLRERK